LSYGKCEFGDYLLGATLTTSSAASWVTCSFIRGCSSGSQFTKSGWHLTVSAIITISAGVITHPLHTRTHLRLEVQGERGPFSFTFTSQRTPHPPIRAYPVLSAVQILYPGRRQWP
jgi:hypothetical protein